MTRQLMICLAAGGLAAGALPACGGSGDECTALTLDGITAVPITGTPTDPPTATGGTLVPGDYTLTAATIYTGSADGSGSGAVSQTVAGRFELTATTFEYVDDVTGALPAVDNVAGTYTVSGTTLTTTNTCPDTLVAAYGYDASPTSFTLYEAGTDATEALVFTLQ